MTPLLLWVFSICNATHTHPVMLPVWLCYGVLDGWDALWRASNVLGYP